jgi:hypothetical protein
MLGQVWGIYGAVAAQDAAKSLLRSARKGDDLYFWGYTLDRDDIVQELIDACVNHRVTVKVMLDKKMTFSGTTTRMFEQVAKLSSNGCLVRMARGTALDGEYYKVGRGGGKKGLEGVSHAKAILSGTWFLCGSTNWTTSSRGNVEKSTLIELTEYASRQQYRLAELEWGSAEEFTEDLRREQENLRGYHTEVPRSRSEPAPRSGFVD